MFVAPAVDMAPWYTRRLFQAMSATEGWDLLVEDSTFAVPDLQCWHDNLDVCSGKPWLKRLQYIHMVGDASSAGLKAFKTHGELPSPMAVSLITCLMPWRLANWRKSAILWLRETNARLAVQTLIDSLPVDLVAGKMCDQTGDCFCCYSQCDLKGLCRFFQKSKSCMRLLHMLT